MNASKPSPITEVVEAALKKSHDDLMEALKKLNDKLDDQPLTNGKDHPRPKKDD